MLSAVEGQAFGESADLSGAISGLRISGLLLGAGLFLGNMFVHVEQRVMVPVARSAPVIASGVLVCETVCSVLVYEN